MTIVKWIIGPIAFAIAFFLFKMGMTWVNDTQAGLSGATRDSFVNAAVGTCLTNQKADPANAAISPPIISEYCKCYANGMADRTSIKDLKTLVQMNQTQMVSAMQSVIEAASKPCLDAASKAMPQIN